MAHTLIELRPARGLLVKNGPAVDGLIIHAPSATRNGIGERDAQKRQSRKGPRWRSL